MGKVTLQEGIFKTSQDKGKEYLLYLDVDRLIAPCYEAIGQVAKKPRYGGWESMQISGHSIGHWLSAAAAMIVATDDFLLMEKLRYALNELEHVQSFDPDGYVSGFPRDCFDQVFTGKFEVENFSLSGSWVPWYSIHKIYAGLIDVYALLKEEKALEIVLKLADWAKKGTDHLTDEQFQRMLICEYGGMNEAMADLYEITGNKDYLQLAIRFCHDSILDPLANEKDDLEGKHANTQIPKVIGAAKLYNLTGEEKYKEMALFFWNQVVYHRSYIIGGNSINEHFGRPNQEKLGIQTTETCNTYNMLILTELLFEWEQKAEYMDFYERALYNHILASQDPETGMKAYFISSQPGHFKVYCSPDNSFWCCTGTGMENPARYIRSIYHTFDQKVYLNLFIASTLRDEKNGLVLTQKTGFPESNTSSVTVEESRGHSVALHVRDPYWAVGSIEIKVNGKEVKQEKQQGYIVIDRAWEKGDVIELTLPMGLHTYEAKDNPTKVGIMYGPIVLAGALGKEKFPESDILDDHLSLNNHPLIEVPDLVADKNHLETWIHRIDDNTLQFKTEGVGQPGNVQITLIPFYELHHERYTLYWNLLDEESYQDFFDHERAELAKLQAITVDSLQPGEQQPEVEHGVEASNSTMGYLNVVSQSYRDARDGGHFSYTLKVNPEEQMYLQVTYFGGDRELYTEKGVYERDFSIFINEELLANEKLTGQDTDDLFHITYDIPLEQTKGKKHIQVKFEAGKGKIAGGVYGVRVINSLV